MGIVTIHEAGHYLAARTFNITVDEFSVGVGPNLVGAEVWGNEFNLRLIPLGGYVRFPRNYNTTLVQEQREAANAAFERRKELEQWSMWQEVANIATLGYWDERRRQKSKKEKAAKEQQQHEAAASTTTTTTTSPPWWRRLRDIRAFKRQKKKKMKSNDKIKTDNIDPEDFEIDYFTDPQLLQNRPWFERAVVMSMGVIFNLILSLALYYGVIFCHPDDTIEAGGLPIPVFESGVIVSAPLKQKNDHAAGLLQQGDVIVDGTGQDLLLLDFWGVQDVTALCVLEFSAKIILLFRCLRFDWDNETKTVLHVTNTRRLVDSSLRRLKQANGFKWYHIH
jgi:membrane-associated protease RseP (regulator of RpoE activity)